ncbi:carbohydrate-binding domain-containing protein [Candidatus Bathyarchaeota archaeon]|nr:carbohydrate-binding domain-containing protein [Candidatus Bathyarchaeota archaeon]
MYPNSPINQQPSQTEDDSTNNSGGTETDSTINDQSGSQDGDDNVPITDSPDDSQSTGDVHQNQPEVPINTDVPPPPHVNEVDHEADGDYVWNSSDVIDVRLNGNSITVSLASAATVDGSKVTIKSAGTYRLNGSLTDGQVIVNTENKETVRLILNNVTIHCSTSAPIYVMKAKKTIIILQENTQNYVTDGNSYTVDSNGEPNGAIFSTSDLTIYGEGSLNVDANYNDGIASKDGLIIKSGFITVVSIDDAIRGKDYIVIKNGHINLNAGGDGLKSDNTENVTRGYVSVENAVIQITAGGDAVDARTDFIMNSGQISVTSGGGSSNNIVAGNSAKGIKAIVSLIVESGTITANSADDAIHSNGTITINGGSFTLSTGDDAIHADDSLTINNGVFVITKSYEGLESAVITINNGNIHLASDDDGINLAGGNDASGSIPGDTFYSSNYHLYINGGYIYVNANGDGIDSNGAITMTGGQVIVDGPTIRMNTAIDHDKPFKMTGGFLLAVGSSGTQIAPPQGPDASSTQYSVMVTFTSKKPAGTIIHLKTNSSGTEIFTFKPIKEYKTMVFCSPVLTTTTYDVYTGGSSTGSITDGLYTGGTYTAGTKTTSFTISSIVTKVGPPPPPF